MNSLLEIKNLKMVFEAHGEKVYALNGISFSVGHGEAVGVIGESGSGKTAAALAVMGLLPPNGRITGGEILFEGRSLTELDEKAMQALRGGKIGMVFQDPSASLNPLFTVGNQLVETIRRHRRLSKAEAREKAVEMLALVGIPDQVNRMHMYPHAFSGGMKQRIMLALALSCGPDLLIADEPTTALDATVQAQIMALMKELKEKTGLSVILITHNPGLVADLCERTVVMYGGCIVEQGRVAEVFRNPLHPYTAALLACVPSMDAERQRLHSIEGQPPHMGNAPAGCPFVSRCPSAMQVCAVKQPAYREAVEGHGAACWLLERNEAGHG